MDEPQKGPSDSVNFVPSPKFDSAKSGTNDEAAATEIATAPKSLGEVKPHDFATAFREVLQARRAARRLIEIDDIIGGDDPVPLSRGHLLALYRECWGILEAAPSILSGEFEELTGVRLVRFAYALHAVAWELLPRAERQSRVDAQERAARFIGPEAFGHE